MMKYVYQVRSGKKEELIDITGRVREAVKESGVKDGLCLVYCPHTTAAVTINENADPDVAKDIVAGLQEALPDLVAFRHMEGNSAAHIKSSVVGASETLIVAGGRLLLGAWQGVYFCEFDGPRQREFFAKVVAG